ncbi:MAG TPA: succinate dehydrogenase, cytochrome b556 subunit [Anaerolineae bacterium]
MTGNGLLSVVEVARYRGRFGQLDWVFRRIAGLAVVLFLLLHIVDTATVYFAPAVYSWFVALYKTPLFGLAEIGLAAAVVYHAMSGLAIIILDLFPALWQYRPQVRNIVWVLFLIGFLPIGGVMSMHWVEHTFIH